ncbi:replication initiation protein [Listeria sp. SHR_NRA_18]|uniref:replication initiation protein n=1 Tax=Listeria sp. SHR_NRA_18 TaxID=2269046 RepID=UPI000F5E14A5|nr:replication initiation protein [Listeria sp. SHR_NRA_18]RQW65354.1 replication initiation protein [Listeria sp. SHR_NRA_18]
MRQMDLFDDQEIENQQNKLITKSVDLVQRAKHSLSAKELTLIDFMVSKVEETDENLYYVQTTIAEINEVCRFGHGGAAHVNTEKALLQLANKGFWLLLEDGTKTVGRWLEKPYIKNGETKLKLDSDMAPHLLNLVDGQRVKSFFKDVINLKSIYAKLLYERLRSYEEDEVEISVSEIKSLFNKESMDWYRVLAYLRKARDDISKNTTMVVDYETVKDGRQTVAILFFKKNKAEVIIDQDGSIIT